MEKINYTLKRVINKKGLYLATEAARVCYLANEWAKGRFEAISFSRGALKLRVDNHAATQECQMLSQRLIEHLNDVLDGEVIKRVRWQVSKANKNIISN